MAEPARDIIILGFRQTLYTKRGPRKPDGTPGEVIQENAPEYWVKYVNRNMPQSTATEDRLRHLDPANARFADGAESGEKLQFLNYRWDQIKPAFDAWLAGQAIPEYGIPLSAWPELNPDHVKMFLASGIKCVEDVRDMTESQLAKVRLPNIRDLKRLAAVYIDGLGNREVAEQLATQKTEIDGLKEQLEAAMQLLREQAEANATTQGGKRQKAA
jgi:hypothetical protein